MNPSSTIPDETATPALHALHRMRLRFPKRVWTACACGWRSPEYDSAYLAAADGQVHMAEVAT